MIDAVQTLDQKTIRLGAKRSCKSSRDLYVDSEKNVSVPRESTYDVELYQILMNWLVKMDMK